MLHTQYPNRIEVTHPDGPHRDQTVQLPLLFASARRRWTTKRHLWEARAAKGFTLRFILADEVIETIEPPCPQCHGTGIAAVMDAEGHYDGEEFCWACDAGRQLADATPSVAAEAF